MTDKKARLLQAENEISIEPNTAPEFLLLYQKSVLLSLKEQGVLGDIQCQQCIDRLISQSQKSVHSSDSVAGAMIPAKGDA